MSFGKSSGGSPIISKEEITGLRNPIIWYKRMTGVGELHVPLDGGTYPSNVQTWWAMKRPVQATPDNLQKQYLEAFDPDMKDQITFGNTLAPKGHYLFDAFKIDRSGESGVAGLDVETTRGERPRAVAFFAGRVFYAGVRASKWGSRIYFSQVLERPESQAGSCHQNQDPTSEDVPDLLPTDGGVIVIPELGTVIRMESFGTALFVFASNGVWQIAGSDGAGFRANDYAVSRLSRAGSLGPHSFVPTEVGLLWWNRDGIWALAPDETGLQYTVSNITDGTIKDFMDNIPDESKKYAKGAYNHRTKIVQWIYRAEAPADITEYYGYNRILNLDTRTGAFYPWKPISDTYDASLELSGIISVVGDAAVETQHDVYAENKQVFVYDVDIVEADGDDVEADDEAVVSVDTEVSLAVQSPKITYTSIEERFKYLMLVKEIV